MAVNYKRLVDLYEQRSRDEADSLLQEAFKSNDLSPANIEFGKLFAECFGWNEYQHCRSHPDYLATSVMSRALTEATGAVSTASFLNIIGQIIYSTILDAYNAVADIFTPLIPEVATQFLDGEKIPGVVEVGDEIAVRGESHPYALAGFGEDWIFTPPLKDRGMIVPVTWEAVFADRTGLVLQRAADLGKWSGRNREKRAIDCVIDENTTADRYNWKGTVIATYGDNASTHTWDNLSATNTLLDWTSLNTIEQLYFEMTDPYTGEVISIEPKHLIVTKQLEQTALRILHATEIRIATPGYATTGNPTQTVAPNTYSGKYTLVTSPLLAARMATDTSWFLGDVGMYAKYMVAEKMRVVTAPPNNKDEFERRIVSQHRVNERGAYVVTQPRVMAKGTVA